MRQPCDKRSLLYENYCITCEEKDAAKIDDEVADEKEKKLRKGKIKLHKYIGETSRSVYERSWEHWSAMEQLNPGSHLLKHLLDIHEDEDHTGVKFGVRVVMFTQSSFERQLQESVVIQQERHHHHLLNSRSEYNRCAVPRLTSKIGDNQYKKYEKEIEEEKEKEEILESKIRKMRKERNRGRKPNKNRDQPTSKRVKLDDNTYKPVRDNWGKPAQKEKGEKRKGEEEQFPKAGKRMRQMKIEKTKTQQHHTPTTTTPQKRPEQTETRQQSLKLGEKTEDFELYNWEEEMRKYKEEIENDEKVKRERLLKKENLEKSWELFRICKKFIIENSNTWKEDKEERERNVEKEEMRAMRKIKATGKQDQLRKTLIQKKITETLRQLPEEEQMRQAREEERMKRLELKEAKQSMWKKKLRHGRRRPDRYVSLGPLLVIFHSGKGSLQMKKRFFYLQTNFA